MDHAPQVFGSGAVCRLPALGVVLDENAGAVPLAVLAHSHVLDLRLPRVTGAGELEVPDDLFARYGDQDAAGVDVGVELAGGVLGMVGRRIGLLDEEEVHSIRQARLDWLTS